MHEDWHKSINAVIHDERKRSSKDHKKRSENTASLMVCNSHPVQNSLEKSTDPTEWTDFTSNELPEIRKNLQQGFQQTQSTVNSWINNFKKRINPEESDEIVSGQGTGGQRQNFGPSQRDQLRGIRTNAQAMRDRRSMDNDRYDADAPALSENFGDLELRDDGMSSSEWIKYSLTDKNLRCSTTTETIQAASQPRLIQADSSPTTVWTCRRGRCSTIRRIRIIVIRSQLTSSESTIINLARKCSRFDWKIEEVATSHIPESITGC